MVFTMVKPLTNLLYVPDFFFFWRGGGGGGGGVALTIDRCIKMQLLGFWSSIPCKENISQRQGQAELASMEGNSTADATAWKIA